MPRFLLSLLAGALIVMGAFIGWTSGDTFADAAGTTARDIGEAVGGDTAATPRASQSSSGSSTTSGSATSTGTSAGSTSRSTTTTAGSPSATPARPTHSTSTTAGIGRECTKPGPTDAAGMNALFTGLDQQPRLEGADHGGSIKLADGRRFFVYGDTIRDREKVSPFMVRNAVAVVDKGCIQVMETPHDGAAIPDRDARVGYWPMSLRAVPTSGGTRVEVITTRVLKTGRGHFETVGPGLAVFDVPTNRMPRLVSQVDIGPDRDDPTHPTWGAAMWEADGYIYLFGTASNAEKSTFGWSLHVARTRPIGITNPSAWEYWDGTSWVSGRSSAATTEGGTLIPAADGVSHNLSVIQRGGSWYAITKQGDYFGTRLAIWKAPSVTGPWTRHDAGSLANDSALRRYTPLAHPDFPTSSGRLLVSYSQGPQTSKPFFSNPELYRPQFIEVALP